MERVSVKSDPSVNTSHTETLQGRDTPESPPVLRLRLKKPKGEKKVDWREGTVDNENMGKKKSKCCCIYKKPVNFGESSSEDDEECEHCFGHPEKRRKNRKQNKTNEQPVSGTPQPTDECTDESKSCNIRKKDENVIEPANQ